MICRPLIVSAALLLFSTPAYTAIEVDGVLDEVEWQDAQSLDTFSVTKPYSLDVPPYTTEVRYIYTDQGIFLAFLNQQGKLERPPQTTLRDQDIQSDFNEVIIDFDGKGLRAFGFKIGRNNAVQDSVWSNENVESTDWDGDWLRAASEGDGYWASELFIPWSLFANKRNEEVYTIGMYLSRWVHDSDTRFSHPAIDRHQKSFVSRFEKIDLSVEPESSIDWFPYARSTYDAVSKEMDYRAGVDMFWRPGSSQQINLSLNPDYGQVESDDLVVNFSAIETFFEEKRPFFRENHELFDIRGPETFRAVHTPRIGGETDAGSEESNDVQAAARYSYVGTALDLGVLAASEDDVRDSQGRDYLALRGRYRLDTAQVGLLHTSTDHPETNRKADITLIDYQLDVLETLKFQGLLIRSDVDEREARSISDNGWTVSAEWEATPLWSHELVLFDYGDQLQLNDLGFVKRVNREQVEYETSLQFPDVSTSAFIRDAEASFEYQWKTNKSSDDLPLEWAVGLEATTASASALSIGFAYVGDGLDDLITEGEGNLYFPSFSTLEFQYETTPSEIARFKLGIEAGESGYDGTRYMVEFSPSIQLGSNLNMDLELSYELNDSWVILSDDDGLGEYDVEEFTVALNAYYIPAKGHEFRVKIESTAVQADGLRSIDNLPDGSPIFSPDSPPDFSESEFAAQLRYRYEISALSEIFVVYSRGGEYEKSDNTDDMSRLLSRALKSRDSESILLKVKLHF